MAASTPNATELSRIGSAAGQPSPSDEKSAAALPAETVIDIAPTGKSPSVYVAVRETIYFLGQYWFFFLSATVLTVAMALLCFSRREGVSFLDDLQNLMPKPGDLGLGRFDIVGETFPFQYSWRLAVRNVPASLTPWICFLLHQFGQFYIMFLAQQAKANGTLKWTSAEKWNPYAKAMLILNAVFIVLHFIQTQIYYDGLAATFTEAGTLLACFAIAIMPFIIEVSRRGLIFGWTPDFFPKIMTEFIQVVREYHGYVASFGIVLTFWYHPMEATYAHVTGFFYIFLLFWQSSLIYQKQHLNRYWTLVLEMFPLLHSAITSFYQGYIEGALHLMFFTSFILLFIVSPMWGIPALQRFLATDPQRRNYLLYGSLAWFFVFAIGKFVSNGTLIYSFLMFAVPILYYVYSLWFFGFFVTGKGIDKGLVELGLVQRKSTAWWIIMSLWGSMSITSIIILGEVIYQVVAFFFRG